MLEDKMGCRRKVEKGLKMKKEENKKTDEKRKENKGERAEFLLEY